MREILFRGKRADNGEWVEGLPIKTYDTEIGKNSVDYANPVPVVLMASGRIVLECGCDEVPFFNTDEYPIVNPETVGQYTGMTDKNGTKIFEGDIVKHIQKYEISGEVKSIAVIKWNEAYSCWSVEYTNGRITAFLGTEYHKLEVIGNVHDNPELLKE